MMIAEDRTRSPSPSTSCTSDDEYNKDSARVYFGPFKTPEKRFASIVAIPDQNTETTGMSTLQDTPKQSGQRSRSSSLLSSTGSDEVMDVERLVGLGEEGEGEGEGETDNIHIGTPQPSSLPNDEPSSALAHRLLRALDNPSPPPGHTHLPEEDDADGADADGEDEVDSAREGEGVPIAPICFPAANTSQTPSHRPASQITDISEPDLMTFDSFDDRLETPAPLSMPSTDAPPSPFSFLNAMVLPPTETRQEDSKSYQAHSNVLIDVQDEEQEISISPLTNQQKKGNIEGAGIQVIEPPIGTTLAEQTADLMPMGPSDLPMISHVHSSKEDRANEPVPEDPPHTPLRRSSRPRKSVTPHLFNLFAVNSPDKDQTSGDPTLHPNAQTRKSRKGKERAGSPFKSIMHIEVEDALMSDPKPPKMDENRSESKDRRRYSKSPVRQELGRELGSLSPNSTNLLSRLITSSSATATLESTPLPVIEHSAKVPSPAPETLPLSSTSQAIQTPSALPSDIDSRPNVQVPISSPMHMSTTPRRQPACSPSRSRLQPASLDDPFRTPARRIPIEQAVAEGLISPQKLSQMQTGTPAPHSIFSGQPMPVLNMSLKGDQSPARRVLAGPLVFDPSGKKIVPRSESPTKGTSRAKGLSSDESSSRPVVAASSQPTTRVSRQAKLPFALAPPKVFLTTELDAVKSTEASIPKSPEKSSLKQTTSRIPRKKPYSRPKPSVLSAEQATVKKNIPTRASSSTAEASVSKQRMVKSRTITGTQNEATSSVVRFARAVELIKPGVNAPAAPISDSSPSDPVDSPPDSTSDNNEAAAVGKLKRKRLDPKTMAISGSRSAVMLRQVPSRTPPPESNVTRPTASSSLRATKPPPSAKIPKQKPTVIKFRRVMAPEASAVPEERPRPPTPPSLSAYTEQNTPERVPEQVLPPSEDVLSSPVKEKPKPLPPQSPSFSQLVFVMEPIPPMSPMPELVTDITIEEQGSHARRKTRPRKPMQVQFVNDISSHVTPTSNSNTTRPLQRRRTNVAQGLRSDADDVFSGMSMTALKTLTANNTVRNQYYAAAKLETEIVRKEGLRPESPAVKIKTTVQRQQEEKVKQREERAARRARRYVNGKSDPNGGEDGENDDLDYRSPSPLDEIAGAQTVGSPLAKHRRGAGDEEDYETPARRFDREIDGKRRVKWDRGLFTEVFLDEVVLGTRARSKPDEATKGCLAPTAKTLRLDTLGNLVDAEGPPVDLTQENIVVKKYVYDDDFEGVEQPAPPVARNTRTKSKKNKS